MYQEWTQKCVAGDLPRGLKPYSISLYSLFSYSELGGKNRKYNGFWYQIFLIKQDYLPEHLWVEWDNSLDY